MIKQIWMLLSVLIVVCILPTVYFQHAAEQEGKSVLFGLSKPSEVLDALGGVLKLIKREAMLNPEASGTHKIVFDKLNQIRISMAEISFAEENVKEQVFRQILIIITVSMAASIFLAYVIARIIVQKFRILDLKRIEAEEKSRHIENLKKWQIFCRMLVHELKSPITPIKLLSSDLVYKYENLSEEEFSGFLQGCQKTLLAQIQDIEDMIETFYTFGRLPDPNFKKSNLSDFLMNFAAEISAVIPSASTLRYDSSCQNIFTNIDTKLVFDLLSNLVSNALEANENKTDVVIKLLQSKDDVTILVTNTGSIISEDVKSKIFDPYVSTKFFKGGQNMGVGLCVAKKIALEHGGDIVALDTMSGASFKITLPILKDNDA